jgi:hypothetical protein
MQVSFLRRLVKEDFPQQYKELVGKVAQVTNPAMEQISLALQKNLTWTDNMAAQVVNIQVTVDSTGAPINPLSFASTLGSNINHLQITRAVAVGNSSIFPTSAPFASFTQQGNNIVISNVTGLPASTPFALTLIASI